MLSFSLVAEASTDLIYHRPSGENFSFVVLSSCHSISARQICGHVELLEKLTDLVDKLEQDLQESKSYKTMKLTMETKMLEKLKLLVATEEPQKLS